MIFKILLFSLLILKSILQDAKKKLYCLKIRGANTNLNQIKETLIKKCLHSAAVFTSNRIPDNGVPFVNQLENTI